MYSVVCCLTKIFRYYKEKAHFIVKIFLPLLLQYQYYEASTDISIKFLEHFVHDCAVGVKSDYQTRPVSCVSA